MKAWGTQQASKLDNYKKKNHFKYRVSLLAEVGIKNCTKGQPRGKGSITWKKKGKRAL